jgi:predicted NBD/HSP70 family sugar kinase
MHTDRADTAVAVFDLGGTWFRWGRYTPARGLFECQRLPAVNHLSHPQLSAADLQAALADFILKRVRESRDAEHGGIRAVGVSIGAPVNAHNMTVLGSGPLWGPSAAPFRLREHLLEAMPELQWHVINDVTALLMPYMQDEAPYLKTMLVTVSSGIGSRLYDHRARCIPYDGGFGVQGEIGHLTCSFELDGRLIDRRCECGGWNHVNAFASGRGIAATLRELPSLAVGYGYLCGGPPDRWQAADDGYRLGIFQAAVERAEPAAIQLLEAFVRPLARTLAVALTLDPQIDRIIVTGGVAHGLGRQYREALERTFLREGIYQITAHDAHYLTRRLQWQDTDDFAGLRGAGIYISRIDAQQGEGARGGAPDPSNGRTRRRDALLGMDREDCRGLQD